MFKSNVDSTSLAAIAIAAAAGFLLLPTGLTWLASILGCVLFVLLLSYDEEGQRSILQSLAFAGVCALCLTLASVVIYQYVYGLPNTREPQLVNRWLPLTCAFTTVLIWVIDRARMGSRVAPIPQERVARPRTTAAEPVSVPAEQPAAPHLVRNEPPAAPVLSEIYVHLTGEALNLMRTVQAEPLGRDYYRIVDTMPENEVWQFTPGQVVRCKKQNLSTGKALVAIEEAPRA